MPNQELKALIEKHSKNLQAIKRYAKDIPEIKETVNRIEVKLILLEKKQQQIFKLIKHEA
ncbi:hypothetical protein COX95_01740 [bacterium CG_4_10_14_0_2_um_filter_33_32]|nr:MAG: hypothetical protein AUJ93_00990 [bacterium CG2_30_33_46]PIR67923.1 MAG: hypothetical protein COU50_00665 [bacterium CG10_big_fil_rev_8_21_14_0_10_33_18]PIU76435.1 MAG: hypothetical protein COS74_04055 [bacterium CG06_land_8_20_14_3_00_33_50]PIY85568.1 MAG: hypothetical protein COY76_01475 [bacterium CG_4_10_14_0_8_um_filter_33_57]PIZ86279.1 MAG: hypothetical protein COX95_01740 [bacterium CG_4_10_14_0_2_um_filter_33_32]PJA71741.1 MAG: hypothetical protein CO152_05080 [bacterium CG_4_9